MAVLREIRDVRQVPGERRRRWFASETVDLIVWLDGRDEPVGFQLCYDKGRSERALTFTPEEGLSHAMVDDGESSARPYKATPVLVTGGHLDLPRVRGILREAERELPEPISTFLLRVLATIPSDA